MILQFLNFQKKEFLFPLLIGFLMTFGFFLQKLDLIDGHQGALIPMTFSGIKGMVFSPFLHSDFEHYFNNLIPMLGLTFLLFKFYPKIADAIFFKGWFFTALGIWLIPFHWFNGVSVAIIGASGIVYMSAFFLFFSAIFSKNQKLLPISALVVLFYGSLLWGIFPQEWFSNDPKMLKISWESHLVGALVGVFLSFYYRKKIRKPKKFIWEYPNYYNEKDDLIWQEYLKNQKEML